VESLIEEIYKSIYSVFTSNVEITQETPSFSSYPFSSARPGHNEAIREILENERTMLTSPTGTGKTAVYLTAAVEMDLKTVVISPRNGLQEEVSKYESGIGKRIIHLFGRAKECPYKDERGNAPCSAKFKRGKDWFVKINDEIQKYPCVECPYDIRKNEILRLFEARECIPVLNQGNFWLLRRDAEFVIIDEADETLRAITDAVSVLGECNSDDPLEVLEWMLEVTQEEIEVLEKKLETERNEDTLQILNKKLDARQNRLRKIAFFRSYPPEKLITYRRKKTTCVEIVDDHASLVDRLFPSSRICIVTATPQEVRGFKEVNFTFPFRARVIYAPIGNLSNRNVWVQKHDDLLEKAVDVIMKTYDYTVKLTGMKKAPIHCGNLSRHGRRVYDLLISNGRNAILMEEGRQRDFVNKFVNENYDFLCAVSIEYGYDWGFSPIQYILKVPYADLGDPRIQAIKRMFGKQKFNDWYNWDALSRVIQAAGRNARSPTDFGITVILDSKFGDLYRKYEEKIPKWFKERIIWLDRGVESGEDLEDNSAA